MKENGFDKYFEYLNSMFSSRVTEEDKFWEVCSTLSFVMVGCLLPPNGLTGAVGGNKLQSRAGVEQDRI